MKKSEIVSLKLEHQNETHVLKRRISVDSMAALGSKGQEGNSATEKLDAKEHREFRSGAGICQYMTEQRFDIAFSTKEIMRGSWTDHSLKDKVKANRALPRRTPAMCVELPLGGKAGRRPCDGGCRLGWKPEDKVLEEYWQLARASQYVIGQ